MPLKLYESENKTLHLISAMEFEKDFLSIVDECLGQKKYRFLISFIKKESKVIYVQFCNSSISFLLYNFKCSHISMNFCLIYFFVLETKNLLKFSSTLVHYITLVQNYSVYFMLYSFKFTEICLPNTEKTELFGILLICSHQSFLNLNSYNFNRFGSVKINRSLWICIHNPNTLNY